ncbi:unnamed protein product [Prunus armeniaca]
MEEFDFRWGGVAPKYSNHENCTLQLHHGGVLESGEYKNGKVCYLDNVIEDFLSLGDLRKVGKGLGYNVDISNPKPNLEMWYRKGGTHGVDELELISSDAKLVDKLGQMPCNRIVVLYYTEVGNSNIVWSQASFGCQGLDGADNYAEKDEADVVDSEEDDGEFVDKDTMNVSNEGPTFEALGEVSSDGEHTSYFDSESEGNGDDMEGDTEGTNFLAKIKRNTYWNLKAFQGEVLESYHVRVSKTQVYRAKRLAKAQIEGNYIQQYARLWDYAEQLKNTNNGSTVKIKPVIGVDACHLKGPYPGQILTVVGVDGITNGLSWVFISNKQKGLIPAIAHNNFIATHLDLTLKHMLWAAARATTIPWWEAEMEKMKEEDLEAWKWLVQRPPKNWTRSHFHPRIAYQRAACGTLKHPVGPRIFKIIEKNKMGAS